MHNPDHTDPICQFSEGAKLLYKHLPGVKLTSSVGLSNLLSWMGTGQGYMTKAFLQQVEGFGGFYSADAQTMISHFERVTSSNITKMAAFNQDSSPTSKTKPPGYIATHDTCVWGQASNHLSLKPTYQDKGHKGHQYTVNEKFSQYFTDEVQQQWVEMLGDMQGRDPQTYEGTCRTWRDYKAKIQELQIPGFNDGLTVFQLANNLVFLGIATMPDCADISAFIDKNRGKGAFRGLQTLGFSMPHAAAVHAAFMCIHNHLEKFLSQSDQGILGFSPIFTEHVLCKVVRWANALKGNYDLYTLGQEAENQAISGDAGENDHCFPFPLKITSQAVIEAIEYAKVSVCQLP